MSKTIEIDGNVYQKIVYRDEPVVTFPMVAGLHQREQKTVRQNFDRNIERFSEGQDYFNVPYEEWCSILNTSKRGVQDGLSCTSDDGGWPKDENQPLSTHGGRRGHMIFLTQLGYIKLIKTFNDDLAWDIYIMVVEAHLFARVPMGCRINPNPEYAHGSRSSA